MSTRCIKTGFHAEIAPHGLWAVGDAFEHRGALILRICHVDREPERKVKHFTVDTWDHWWDEAETSMERNSTMIVSAGDWTDHGYDGVPL